MGLQRRTMAAPAGAWAVIAAPDRRRWLWPVLVAALGLCECGRAGAGDGRGGRDPGPTNPSRGSGSCARAPRRGGGAACVLGAGD